MRDCLKRIFSGRPWIQVWLPRPAHIATGRPLRARRIAGTPSATIMAPTEPSRST